MRENNFLLVSPAVVCDVGDLDIDITAAALGYTPSGIGGTLGGGASVTLTCAGSTYHSGGRTSVFVCRFLQGVEVWTYNEQSFRTAPLCSEWNAVYHSFGVFSPCFT